MTFQYLRFCYLKASALQTPACQHNPNFHYAWQCAPSQESLALKLLYRAHRLFHRTKPSQILTSPHKSSVLFWDCAWWNLLAQNRMDLFSQTLFFVSWFIFRQISTATKLENKGLFSSKQVMSWMTKQNKQVTKLSFQMTREERLAFA